MTKAKRIAELEARVRELEEAFADSYLAGARMATARERGQIKTLLSQFDVGAARLLQLASGDDGDMVPEETIAEWANSLWLLVRNFEESLK